jgi:hypothetical protein
MLQGCLRVANCDCTIPPLIVCFSFLVSQLSQEYLSCLISSLMIFTFPDLQEPLSQSLLLPRNASALRTRKDPGGHLDLDPRAPVSLKVPFYHGAEK